MANSTRKKYDQRSGTWNDTARNSQGQKLPEGNVSLNLMMMVTMCVAVFVTIMSVNVSFWVRVAILNAVVMVMSTGPVRVPDRMSRISLQEQI